MSWWKRKKGSSKTYVDSDGYKRYKNSDKSVHKHVAVRKLGRKLKKGEVVHHKNRNKLDNRRKNLWVFKSQNDIIKPIRNIKTDLGFGELIH